MRSSSPRGSVSSVPSGSSFSDSSSFTLTHVENQTNQLPATTFDAGDALHTLTHVEHQTHQLPATSFDAGDASNEGNSSFCSFTYTPDLFPLLMMNQLNEQDRANINRTMINRSFNFTDTNIPQYLAAFENTCPAALRDTLRCLAQAHEGDCVGESHKLKALLENGKICKS